MLLVIFILLGQWQLQRASERRAIQANIEHGQQLSTLLLQDDTPESEWREWRTVSVTGVWQPQFSVLLNRNHQGRPGYWLATPLLLGHAPHHKAVLVLRGWFERRIAPAPLPDFPLAAVTVTIQGQLLEHVPRLLELRSLSGEKQAQLPARLPLPGPDLPQVQNLELNNMEQASGLVFLPVVVRQMSGTEDGLTRDWATPPVDYHKNTAYAMQWFGFALIALLAMLFVGYRMARHGKSRSQHE
ncbi:SURF1-like protein [Advenella faeciporci]|uniref:SURF1-like protein n=2 Tax=Advenella faeciporci TaxID=797535 RepID=A0A918JIU3_9BURK|nr:SURF1-like protein [Advenella faeciporci]